MPQNWRYCFQMTYGISINNDKLPRQITVLMVEIVDFKVTFLPLT